MTDNWNLTDHTNGDDWHPAMRRQPDPTVDPRVIHHRSTRALSAQQRLLAELNQVHLLSKTQAKVAGQIVTLDPATGDLTCTCETPDCRHAAAVAEQARRRVPR